MEDIRDLKQPLADWPTDDRYCYCCVNNRVHVANKANYQVLFSCPSMRAADRIICHFHHLEGAAA